MARFAPIPSRWSQWKFGDFWNSLWIILALAEISIYVTSQLGERMVGDVRFLPDYTGFATNSGRRTRVLLGLLVTQNGLWHLADPTRFNI